jgi:NADH-quinone oxidoreductase subunit L
METVLPGATAPYSALFYAAIPGLPFLGFLLNGLLNKKLSGTLAGLVLAVAHVVHELQVPVHSAAI